MKLWTKKARDVGQGGVTMAKASTNKAVTKVTVTPPAVEKCDIDLRRDERGELVFHPASALFPLMSGRDYSDLVADIEAHGLREAIVVHPNGTILDGRNRYRACRHIGAQVLVRRWDGKPGDEFKFVLSVNMHRRHLTADQKREIIAKLLKEKPEISNVQIGRMAKADDKTVAVTRRKMEATSEIPKLEKRIGADGRARRRKEPAPGHDAAVAVMAGSVTTQAELECRRVLRYLDGIRPSHLSDAPAFGSELMRHARRFIASGHVKRSQS